MAGMNAADPSSEFIEYEDVERVVEVEEVQVEEEVVKNQVYKTVVPEGRTLEDLPEMKVIVPKRVTVPVPLERIITNFVEHTMEVEQVVEIPKIVRQDAFYRKFASAFAYSPETDGLLGFARNVVGSEIAQGHGQERQASSTCTFSRVSAPASEGEGISGNIFLHQALQVTPPSSPKMSLWVLLFLQVVVPCIMLERFCQQLFDQDQYHLILGCPALDSLWMNKLPGVLFLLLVIPDFGRDLQQDCNTALLVDLLHAYLTEDRWTSTLRGPVVGHLSNEVDGASRSIGEKIQKRKVQREVVVEKKTVKVEKKQVYEDEEIEVPAKVVRVETIIEVPEIQFVDKVVDVPIQKQVLVPVMVEKCIEEEDVLITYLNLNEQPGEPNQGEDWTGRICDKDEARPLLQAGYAPVSPTPLAQPPIAKLPAYTFWMSANAFVQCGCVLLSQVLTVFVFWSAETPKDIVFDSLGLLFLSRLDDIGGDLGLIQESEWPSDSLGMFFRFNLDELSKFEQSFYGISGLNEHPVPRKVKYDGKEYTVPCFSWRTCFRIASVLSGWVCPILCILAFLCISFEPVESGSHSQPLWQWQMEL